MNTSNRYLSEIYIYPVKSARGISLKKSIVDSRGLRFDRRWMVIDENNTFISQRKFPVMATVETGIDEKNLILKSSDMPEIRIPLESAEKSAISVKIWKDTCAAYFCGREAADWFSHKLGINCRLVYMPENSNRPVDRKYSHINRQVSFADGYPFLILSDASLDDLNNRLHQPLPVNRFRPNLVLAETAPYEEDKWREILIGNIRLHVVKPCSRCVITTTDQKTGKTSKEPLRTLATYRKFDDKVLFGQNAVHENEGELKTGDSIEIIR